MDFVGVQVDFVGLCWSPVGVCWSPIGLYWSTLDNLGLGGSLLESTRSLQESWGVFKTPLEYMGQCKVLHAVDYWRWCRRHIDGSARCESCSSTDGDVTGDWPLWGTDVVPGKINNQWQRQNCLARGKWGGEWVGNRCLGSTALRHCTAAAGWSIVDPLVWRQHSSFCSQWCSVDEGERDQRIWANRGGNSKSHIVHKHDGLPSEMTMNNVNKSSKIERGSKTQPRTW